VTIQRKVLTAIVTVTTIVVLLFAIPLGIIFERLLDDRAVSSLEHRADVAARSIDLTDPSDKPDASELPAGDVRSALYSPAGVRTLGVGPLELESELRVSPTGSRNTIESGSDLVTSIAVISGEKTLGYVRVARNQQSLKRVTQLALAALTAMVLAVLLVGFLLGRRLSANIGRTAQQLSDAATRLGEGDFNTTFTTTGIREFDNVGSALATTARSLSDLIDREQAFSADASHQLRTPITALKTSLETEIAFPRPDRLDILHESVTEVDRLQGTVTDLLALARAEQQGNRQFDVSSVALAAATHWNVHAQREGRNVKSVDHSKHALALGNPGLLRQALDALLENSIAHGEGAVNVAVTSDDHAITVMVSDEGPGFEFGDAKSAEDSTRVGLGLPLVQRLIRAQGGRLITAHTNNESQVQILLRLPPSTDADKSAVLLR
jgi:signal transduction histidine kinase